jgi:hypothetical protein
VTTDLIATYRELARLQTQLTEDVTRYRNEIHALLQVLFPEYSQVFADPCRPTALSLLKLYPSAQACATARVETIAAKLHELAPRNYGLSIAQQLVSLAHHSVSSGVALSARSTSLKILGDQLEHTQANLIQLEKELENLMKTDSGAKGLQSVPEFAGKTMAVLREELGDVDRFACSSQAVAYAGLDIEVKQSGKSRGQVKLSKRGSGRIRRILYMAVVRCIRLKDSAFGAYYHHLVARGRPRRAAMMAVMRKMLMVAYRLLKTKEAYDPTKVFAQAVVQAPALETQPGQPHLAHAGA